MFYYVYLLRSKKTGELYKGFTGNLRERVKRHNAGLVESTQSGKPWELIYFEGFRSKKDALREELFLKSGQGRQRLKYLLRDSGV